MKDVFPLELVLPTLLCSTITITLSSYSVHFIYPSSLMPSADARWCLTQDRARISHGDQTQPRSLATVDGSTVEQ